MTSASSESPRLGTSRTSFRGELERLSHEVLVLGSMIEKATLAAVVHILTDLERTIDPAMHLLWAAHNLERVADQAQNVCERVLFMPAGGLHESSRWDNQGGGRDPGRRRRGEPAPDAPLQPRPRWS